jgi:hypothetical protein
MYRLFAALTLASIWMLGAIAPGSAQSCSDFGSVKEAQQQLEQGGDPAGALDPDLNGFACDQGVGTTETAAQESQPAETTDQTAQLEQTTDQSAQPAAQDIPVDAAVTLNQDGPVVSDDSSGDSGMTVTQNPGEAGINNADGAGNSTGDNGASDVSVSDTGATAGDAATTNDATGETAVADDAVAVDTDTSKPAREPKPEAAPAPVLEPAPAPAPAAAPAVPAAVQLPNTGVGAVESAPIGSTVLALLGLTAACGLFLSRRFYRI